MELAVIILGFLGTKLGAWISGLGTIGVVGTIVTVLRKKGYILTLKGFSKKAAVVTKEIGEFFTEVSDVFEATDKAISDDGHLIENNVKEVIAAGKEAVVEFKDVVVVIKKKVS